MSDWIPIAAVPDHVPQWRLRWLFVHEEQHCATGSLVVSVTLRVVAFVSCYGLVWLQRKRLIRFFTDFLLHWRNHWPILCRIAGFEALQRLQWQLSKILLRQLLVNLVMLVCSILIQYQLFTGSKMKLIVVKASHMLMISTMRIGFCTLLVLLNHQFEAVLLSLQALHQASRLGSRSSKDIQRIAAIHWQWLQLAKRAFHLYDVAIASVWANMFAVNVSILYHAIQYINYTIKSNWYGYIIGDGLLIFTTWNSVLVMNLVERTINSCNEAGQLLRHFNDLPRLSPESQKEVMTFNLRRLLNNPEKIPILSISWEI